MNKFLLAFFVLITSVKVCAQTYPVTVNVQLIPPHSVYLSDYVSAENEKLFVSLLFNDLTIPSYNVKLRLTIEGVGIKIETSPDVQLPPISINSGMLERLGAAELSPYFDANNLIFQGISKQQYQKNAALPEGFYKFCIQAFDYNKNIAVSNKACYSAWLVLNDPPRINTPACNGLVKAIYPQNLLFQWIPMHLSSPNISSRTSYHFKLVQIIPKGRNPNDALNTSPSIFEATTENSILYYGISEPQLIPGEQYAWRVQAKDAGGKDLFKNNGYSEVCMFTYGEPCLAPVNIKIEMQNPGKVKLSWDNKSGASNYIVRYREKNNNAASWYENESYTTSNLINDLKPGVQYEYQVLSVCEPIRSEYSRPDTFTTMLPSGTLECGQPLEIKSIDKTTQLANLFPNDVIEVDGFKVRIISATGGNGVFSGKGVAYIPFLGINVKMNFNSIKVNTSYEVYEGQVRADKASLEKYRSSIPSSALKNDICQDISDDNETKNNLKQGEKDNDVKNTPNDSFKVIVINGDIKVKPGDVIIVNGKEVVVTEDTKIKPGDVVVVNGKTVKVDTIKTEMGSNSLASFDPVVIDLTKNLILEMRKGKFDSLVTVREDYRKVSEKYIDQPISNSVAITQYNKSFYSRSYKIIDGKVNTDIEKLKDNKNSIYKHLESIAICNTMLQDEEMKKIIEKLNAGVLENKKDWTDEDSIKFKQLVMPVLITIIEEYRSNLF